MSLSRQVTSSINYRKTVLDTAKKKLSEAVKAQLPKGTVVKRGNQTYEILRHGMWWSRPADITLKNINNDAEIKVSVTDEDVQEKLTVVERPDQ